MEKHILLILDKGVASVGVLALCCDASEEEVREACQALVARRKNSRYRRACAEVDGKKIKAGVFYQVKRGKFVEAEETE